MDANELIKNIRQTPILPPIMVGKLAVLFSYSQKCFHVEFLIEYITENYILSTSGKEGDYRLLGITNTEMEAHELIEEIKAYFSFINFKY